MRMAVYGIREVRASERVSERVSRVVRVSTRECLFIGQSAQLVAIRIATVVHGYTGRQDGGRCNFHAKDDVPFACTLHAHGRCLITASLHAGACKWSVACPACMHEIYIRVGALLCFLACKLAGTCYYLCAKNINGV